jgi:ABC-type branched-subunit amino acid transport system substrate-binding protein
MQLSDLLNRSHHIDVQVDIIATLFIVLCLFLPGCAFPGSTKPVIKIGLIAPFEGEQRPNGYQRLYGVKLALQEVNLAGGVAGYKIELVALNDYANMEEAISQAQELVVDSDIRAIVGQWDPTLFNASASVYTAAKLAVIEPSQFVDFSSLPPTFTADFEALGGSIPDQQAKQAYLATYRLLTAIEQATIEFGSPERVNVWRTFRALN